MDKPAELEDRLIDFAVRTINVVEALPSTKAGNHVAGNLFVLERLQRQTTVRRKVPNLEGISSTK